VSRRMSKWERDMNDALSLLLERELSPDDVAYLAARVRHERRKELADLDARAFPPVRKPKRRKP